MTRLGYFSFANIKICSCFIKIRSQLHILFYFHYIHWDYGFVIVIYIFSLYLLLLKESICFFEASQEDTRRNLLKLSILI